jgi:Tol biopolymer transport system component
MVSSRLGDRLPERPRARQSLDIYLMDADGSRQRRLVMHPGGGGEIPINTADDYALAWGPTGWVIAFATKRDGNEEIYSMDPIGFTG